MNAGSPVHVDDRWCVSLQGVIRGKRQDHERRTGKAIKVTVGCFSNHRRTEGSQVFAELDDRVYLVAIRNVARVGENASLSEGTWPSLHPPLKPTNNVTLGELASRRTTNVGRMLVLKVGELEGCLDRFV